MAIIKIRNTAIDLDAAEIPNLAASKITTGSLGTDRIPDLAASKITSGTFPEARLPSTTLNSNVDLTNLNASNLTSGTVALARLGTGTPSSSNFLRGDGTFAEAGGGKLLQYKISSDSSSRSQTGNFNSELSNTMGNTITPTKVGSRIIAWTSKIRWYTYGAGTLSLRRDGSVVNSMSHSNSGYPDSNEIETSLYNEFTTTGTSQLSYTINLQDTGSSAGSGALLFNQAQGVLHLLEIDA